MEVWAEKAKIEIWNVRYFSCLWRSEYLADGEIGKMEKSDFRVIDGSIMAEIKAPMMKAKIENNLS